MEEIDGFETKIKNIKELIIDTIEHDYIKLIGNLNMRKGFEIKLEKIKTSKTIVGTIKKQLFQINAVIIFQEIEDFTNTFTFKSILLLLLLFY